MKTFSSSFVRPILVAIILILAVIVGTSQSIKSKQYDIEYFAQEEHSYGVFINSILQDNQGFLWLGTNQGLYKHDGHEFKRINLGDKSVDEIWELHTRNLTKDQNGNIWGYSHGSIFNYNPISNEKWISDLDLPYSISNFFDSYIIDGSEGIWLGSSLEVGLRKFRISHEALSDSLIYPDFKNITQQYPKAFFNLLDSLQTDTLVTLLRMGDNENVARIFEISDDTYISVICMGQYSTYPWWGDTGWIEDSTGEIVLSLNLKDGHFAGGDISNRISVKSILLQPGNYTLHYKSDDEHSFGNWTVPQPSHSEYWGIQVFKFNNEVREKVDQLTKIPEIPELLQYPIMTTYQNEKGQIWAGTRNGLIRVIPGNEENEYIDQYKKIPISWTEASMEGSIHGIEEIKNGGMILFSLLYSDNGDSKLSLDQYDASDGSITNLSLVDGKQFEQHPTVPVHFEYDQITKDIWLGFYQAGLYKWEFPYTDGPVKIVSRSGISIPNSITDLLIDHSGSLWLSTALTEHGWGLFKLFTNSDKISFQELTPPRAQKIASPVVVKYFSEDIDGKVWISTMRDGIYGINNVSSEIDHVFPPDTFPSPRTGLPVSWSNVFSDSNKNIWVGSINGKLFQFLPKTKTFVGYTFPNDKYKYKERAQIDIRFEDHEGFLWGLIPTINHDNVIIKFDPNSKKFLMDSSISDINRLMDFQIDKNNVLWIATGGMKKFYKIDLESGKEERVAYNMIWDFEIDSTGMIWAATMNEGLALIDPKTRLIERITEENGLLSNNIPRLLQDKNGKLWLMTSAGITVLDPATKKFSTPQQIKGLEGFNTNVGRPFISSTGRLYVRTTRKGGFYTFHPDSIKLNPIPPKIAITDFQLINSRSSSDNEAFQNKDLARLEELDLSHSQNSLSIEYRGLHYDNPEENKYSIWMDGLDEDWVNVGQEKVARYSKLAPGNYNFHVRASNADGIWSEPTSVSFTINPPWYWAWYTKLFYALIVLGALYYWIQGLRKKVKLKQAQLAKEQEHGEVLEQLNIELNEINAANQKFVPQDFMNILGKSSIRDLKLGDQTSTHMTVLFADIRSYTQLSETMSPDENFRFINGYLGRVGPLIKSHGGFIDKYMGDGLMALFLDNHLAAIRASVEIQKALNKYNRERVAKDRQPIKTGIGLNTGPLMLGIIGDRERYDSTVIADSVNTASRMEGLTKIFGASIILSGKTLQELTSKQETPEYAYRYLGKIKVKGRDKSVDIYDLYEGDPVSVRQLKAKTQSDFEKGLTHYAKREFGKAAEFFKNVLEVNESDKAAQYYLDKCVDYIVNDVPEGWAGVEEMMMK